jgi:hypothetical protein
VSGVAANFPILASIKSKNLEIITEFVAGQFKQQQQV